MNRFSGDLAMPTPICLEVQPRGQMADHRLSRHDPPEEIEPRLRGERADHVAQPLEEGGVLEVAATAPPAARVQHVVDVERDESPTRDIEASGETPDDLAHQPARSMFQLYPRSTPGARAAAAIARESVERRVMVPGGR